MKFTKQQAAEIQKAKKTEKGRDVEAGIVHFRSKVFHMYEKIESSGPSAKGTWSCDCSLTQPVSSG